MTLSTAMTYIEQKITNLCELVAVVELSNGKKRIRSKQVEAALSLIMYLLDYIFLIRFHVDMLIDYKIHILSLYSKIYDIKVIIII